MVFYIYFIYKKIKKKAPIKFLTIAATTLLSMMKASQAMMLKAGTKDMAMLQEAIEDQAEI